ncbi:MAG: DUF167 domain-containing protein [Dehalococcoidia bacterium]|nr:DUF167 domain-containing protein [Dehalococcoidia bacterium]
MIKLNKMILSIHVTPGAKKNAVTDFAESEWHIKVAAPPVGGKANEELIKFLCSALELRKNAVSVIKGKTARNKLVSIDGMPSAEVIARLSTLIQKERP